MWCTADNVGARARVCLCASDTPMHLRYRCPSERRRAQVHLRWARRAVLCFRCALYVLTPCVCVSVCGCIHRVGGGPDRWRGSAYRPANVERGASLCCRGTRCGWAACEGRWSPGTGLAASLGDRWALPPSTSCSAPGPPQVAGHKQTPFGMRTIQKGRPMASTGS